MRGSPEGCGALPQTGVSIALALFLWGKGAGAHTSCEGSVHNRGSHCVHCLLEPPVINGCLHAGENGSDIRSADKDYSNADSHNSHNSRRNHSAGDDDNGGGDADTRNVDTRQNGDTRTGNGHNGSPQA